MKNQPGEFVNAFLHLTAFEGRVICVLNGGIQRVVKTEIIVALVFFSRLVTYFFPQPSIFSDEHLHCGI